LVSHYKTLNIHTILTNNYYNVAAVSNLKERKGSSRPAIKKYILANYKVSPGAHFDSQISGAIRRGAAKDVFSLPKGNVLRSK